MNPKNFLIFCYFEGQYFSRHSWKSIYMYYMYMYINVCVYIYIYVYIYNIYIYIYYICIYCISSNWHRISLWIEGDRGRPPFGTTFQKRPLLLSVPPLFSPSVKIKLPYFFFMFLLFLHGRRRHWKKGTAHREILQKFLLRFAFSGV